MASPKFPVTVELQSTVERKLNIAEVYFTADGHHHFTAHSTTDKKNTNLYTRLQEVPLKTAAGLVIANKFEFVPIRDYTGKKDDERYLIVQTCTRNEVLEATPSNKAKASAIERIAALATLEVTEEEIKAFLAQRNKKGK